MTVRCLQFGSFGAASASAVWRRRLSPLDCSLLLNLMYENAGLSTHRYCSFCAYINVKSGEIAIPEIQRPFVWEATKVRNLLDSLYQGYPIGYLIAWRNPTVKLKDGTSSAGKRILIDGQQRVTALMADLLAEEVVTKDYERTRIRIAFHPQEERFEVFNPAIGKNSAWIPDVAEVFAASASLFTLVSGYCTQNTNVHQDTIFHVIEPQGIGRKWLSESWQRCKRLLPLRQDWSITQTRCVQRPNRRRIQW